MVVRGMRVVVKGVSVGARPPGNLRGPNGAICNTGNMHVYVRDWQHSVTFTAGTNSAR